MSLRVLLVDDVAELRGVLRQALRLRGGFDVVDEAGDGAGAVDAAASHQPDVIVLDLGLPDFAGRELVTRVRDAAPESQIVVYTGSVTAERSGVLDRVNAFVRKDQDVAYLVELLGNLDRAGHHEASLRLGPDLADVAEARRFVADHCRQWGCGAALTEAKLVVSELVTNALLHAGGSCELRIRFVGGLLRFDVQDEGAGAPDPQVPSTTSEHGRGLLLVSATCVAWGVESDATDGKVVWAEMVVPADASPGSDSGGREPAGSEPLAG